MKRVPGVVAVLAILGGAVTSAQDPLAAAKDLYAAASYEEALTTLSRLADGASPDLAGQINQYRAFSLFALGRTAEAEKVAETLIRENPLVKLNEAEVSPRIEAMFASVRKRVLPALIRDEYRTARAAIDRSDLKAAEPHLQMVSRMLAEARATGTLDETLTDLGLIVDGFLGLSQATTAQQKQQQAAAPPAPSGGKPPAAAADSTAASPPRVAPTVYSGNGDSRLTPPVAIAQTIPVPPATVSEVMRRSPRKNVVIELTINERGEVQDAAVIETSEPIYDAFVLAAARQWRYRPATLDGVPVKFRRSVSIAFGGGR